MLYTIRHKDFIQEVIAKVAHYGYALFFIDTLKSQGINAEIVAYVDGKEVILWVFTR